VKRYLFFLRSHNDTDNIAPAVWALLNDDPAAEVDIVYYHLDYPYRMHSYIDFLDGAFGGRLKVRWLGEFLGLNYERFFGEPQVSSAEMDRIRRALRLDPQAFVKLLKLESSINSSRNSGWRYGLVGKLLRQRPGPMFRKPALEVGKLHLLANRLAGESKVIPEVVLRDFIAWLIGNGPLPCLAVFDQQRGTSLVSYFKALRRAGVESVVRLPVSPMMNVNVLRQTKHVALDRKAMERELDFSGFDAVSYTDHHYPASVKRMFEEMGWKNPLEGNLEVLGAIRYCPEWMAERPPPPVFQPEDADDRIRLVFFLSRAEINSFWQEVERTIGVFDSFPRFRVIVQPHPRDLDVLDVGTARAELRVDIPAPSLIAWADVVVLWGSSVGLEALLMGKTLLCLDYVNANRNVYEMMNAGWILRCRDDLVLALTKLEREPDFRPYSQFNVDRLIQEMVLAGGGKPVPQRYVEFLRAHEKHTE
jgi:hypothetical protein